MKTVIYNQKGEKTGQTELPSEIFEVGMNQDLLHQVVRAQMANRRQVSAHTKTRGEVRGGGRKPWRQKGTGRARHGSIRSPIWVGGGITFGPRKDRNYKQKINKKMGRKALLIALSSKAKSNEIVVLEDLKIEKPKTKEFVMMIQNLKSKIQDLDKNTLVVLPTQDENIIKSAKNLPYLDTTLVQSLNALDVLRFKYLLMPKKAIEAIKETFIKVKSPRSRTSSLRGRQKSKVKSL